MNVLVLEDDALSAEVLSVRLELLGCRVTRVWTVEAALETAARERPDLILAEVRLHGDRGAGLRLVEGLGADARTASIPVVVHSIYVFQGVDAPELAGRVAGYLPKPFRTPELTALVAGHRPALAG